MNCQQQTLFVVSTMESSQARRAALVVSNASRDYTCGSFGVIMNQNEPGTHTQGQNSGNALNLTDTPEVQYTHLQSVILEFPDLTVDTSAGLDGSAAQTWTTPWNVESTLIASPVLSTEAVDLTTVRSPSMCGDVLWSVLDKIRADVELPSDGSSSLSRPCSAVRACLEKRFNSMAAAADMLPQDAQSAALTKFRAMIEHSSDDQDAFINPLMQNWTRSGLENPMELSVPYGGSMLNTFADVNIQVLGNWNLPHMVELDKLQGPVTKAQCNVRTIPTGEQQQKRMKIECKGVAVAKPVKFVKIAKKRSPLSSKDPNAMPSQQDAHSATITKFQSMSEQPSEGQAAFINPLMQNWIKSDLENPVELSVPHGGIQLNTDAGMHRNVLGNLPRMVEPNILQSPISNAQYYVRTIPAAEQQQQMKTECKNVAVTSSAKIAKKRSPLSSKDGNATQDSENWMAGLLSTKICAPKHITGVREKHNYLERVRRGKISQCCDELNSLVPFCDKHTDKANTLLRTTAFLKYIDETYGDSIKQDFKIKVLSHQTKSLSNMRT